MIDEQSDGGKETSAAFDGAADVSSDGVSSSNSQPLTATSDASPIGIEEKELASAIISSAVVKAVVALGWQQDEVEIGKAQKPVPYFARPSVGPTLIMSTRAKRVATGAIGSATVAATTAAEEILKKSTYHASPIVGGA